MTQSRKRTLVSFDFAIKYILRHKENFDILEGFLACLLGFKFKIQNIIETETNSEEQTLKIARIDIAAKTTEGAIITIEVQYTPDHFFHQRALFSVSRTIVDNINRGEKYESIPKIYSVNIAYFTLFPSDEAYAHHAKLSISAIESEVKKLAGRREIKFANQDDFPEYYYLEVNKFAKKGQVRWTHLEEWTYFLQTSKVESYFTAPGLHAAAERLKVINLDKQARLMWDRQQENLARERSILNYQFEQGIEQGREQGIEQGIEQGREQTRKEERKKRARGAKIMLRRGDSPEDVALISDLPLEEVLVMKKKLDNES